MSATPAPSPPLSIRWSALMHAVLAGVCVPFTGAGVSRGARDPLDPTFCPTVEWLVPRVRRLRWMLGRTELSGAQVDPNDFSRNAELAALIVGQARLVAELAMPSFARVETLPAHRYLARLVREGWVREIFTTNWDTCFERAYRGTFSHERAGRAARLFPAVVTTEAEYRAAYVQGSVDGLDGSGEPVLRLFKLNGCAAPWASATGRPDPARILLTDSQLAKLSEAWKADLLRDRLRAMVLLFTGFGSDEAQVRHTVLDVVRNAPGGLGGAPFVSAYDKAPSFTQVQILAASEPRPTGGWARFFGGADAAALSGSEGTTGLAADLFWKRVYQAAMWHRIHHHLDDPGSVIRRVISLVDDAPRTGGRSLVAFREWLGLPPGSHGAEVQPLGLERLIGRQWRLWEERQAKAPGDHTMVLQALLRAARGACLSAPDHLAALAAPQWEYYRRFHEDEHALSLLLLALWSAGERPGWAGASLPGSLSPAEVDLGLLPLAADRSEHALIMDPTHRAMRRIQVVGPASGVPNVTEVWSLAETSRGVAERVWVRLVSGASDQGASDQAEIRVSCFVPRPVPEVVRIPAAGAPPRARPVHPRLQPVPHG